MILTKTFIHNAWYRHTAPGVFQAIPSADATLDEQIELWVRQTGFRIVDPGQLGMHTAWHGTSNDPYHLKCLTFGLTVLYEGRSNDGERTTQPTQYGIAADGHRVGTGEITVCSSSVAP